MNREESVVVYLLRDTKGSPYVGITVNYPNRLKQHQKSKRFADGISFQTILEHCESYAAAEERETFFVEQYDSYENGLNRTKDGKGLNPGVNFSTYRFVYSEESRKKMSESAKARGPNRLGHTPSKETREAWSKKRKGVVWGPKMFTDEFVQSMREEYENETLFFDENTIKGFVKKTDIDKVAKVLLTELKMKSGHQLTYKSLFIDHYAKKCGVTKAHIRNILDRKSYNGAIHQSKREI